MASPETATPIALTIAGSDSSGGAGIQADLKTFTALGVYGASVITAITAQNTQGVQGVLTLPSDIIAAQMTSVASDLAVTGIKTGMLGDRVTVETVADGLAQFRGVPLVIDPVMVATSGDVLLAPDAVEAVRTRLFPLATVVTPNLREAARLLEGPVASTDDEMETQGRRLLALGPEAVLIKGGHGEGAEATDILVLPSGSLRFSAPRIATRNTHGTGCTLAAAIAARLAEGDTLPTAVNAAKDFVWQAISAGRALRVGNGDGPVDHLHAIRRR
ncbi:bifunctional hydroxymethylpyrimidine kinase/phosphomethylpyrimidine kinase [Hyphomicrobium sp.]|uniref:bifunctional hydroxymethylpyrimidine kinase/phosphomethylpyrimidine kinase n=1 Tax=Hyphomicrobium sp. TaxID=82 RepID=UPI0025B9E229|nr:bifunctional hydroxymethylpyrimidine kinase/phosphomethylpyrimidine kinase [Hyphomicrobium sp.]MCC7250756.1 bifunctional hydroxymethylpyrimidine kinase/phosphomethylpyrimidine kinase [Hyphomicrobium sp.]